MKKTLKSISIFLMVTVFLAASVSLPVAADNTKTIPIENWDSKKPFLDVTLTNFVSESQAVTKAGDKYTVYTVKSPSKITFVDEVFAIQEITYAKNMSIDSANNFVNEDAPGESFDFDVQKYMIFKGETLTPVDKIPDNFDDMIYFQKGNYATFKQPGLYVVTCGVEAIVPTTFVVRVLDAKAATPASSITKLELAKELVVLKGLDAEVVKDKDKYAKLCTYKDVPAASKHYVGYCISKGWISPKNKSEFGIKDKATETIAAQAVLKANGKAVNITNTKAVIGKTSPLVTKERIKEMFTKAKALKK